MCVNKIHLSVPLGVRFNFRYITFKSNVEEYEREGKSDIKVSKFQKQIALFSFAPKMNSIIF